MAKTINSIATLKKPLRTLHAMLYDALKRLVGLGGTGGPGRLTRFRAFSDSREKSIK